MFVSLEIRRQIVAVVDVGVELAVEILNCVVERVDLVAELAVGLFELGNLGKGCLELVLKLRALIFASIKLIIKICILIL